MKWLIAFVLFSFACTSEKPNAVKPAPPIENNAAYSMAPLNEYYVISNDLTTSLDSMSIQIDAPENVSSMQAWASSLPPIELTKSGNRFSGTISLTEVPPGQHELVVGTDNNPIGVLKQSWNQTHPLYVVVSTDWDDADNPEHTYRFQEELHDEHPELLLTHFVGPYTFTDPLVSSSRKTEIVDWLLSMENDYNDEIGLHIHPYCNFVDSIGSILGSEDVACRHAPSTVYDEDESGYTVILDSYSQEEQKKMFLASDALFTQHGLSKPTSFRAGGWTTGLKTLKAMNETGYVADTSANNWARMEEWQDRENGVLYRWNQEQWSSIGDTSQPYYPAVDNLLEFASPSIPVLEVPDNGILVDYVSTNEMIDVFEANWPGGSLDVPKAYSIGYHPPNFGLQYKYQITNTLHHVDQFLASAGQGPVIYAALSDLIKVWPHAGR